MKYIKELIEFLEKLEEHKIYYSLEKARINTIMVDVALPGERWEIEFNTYGTKLDCDIEIERYKSDGILRDEKELDELFEDDYEKELEKLLGDADQEKAD